LLYKLYSLNKKKQMSFADSKRIPFVALIGEKEISKKVITLRNMQTGEQKEVDLEGLLKELANPL